MERLIFAAMLTATLAAPGAMVLLGSERVLSWQSVPAMDERKAQQGPDAIGSARAESYLMEARRLLGDSDPATAARACTLLAEARRHDRTAADDAWERHCAE